MSKTASGLIEHCKDAVKKGVKYVYGAKWQVLTKAQIQALQNTYGKSCVWDSDLKKAGHLCCDCSGLISSYTGVTRGSTNYKDTATASVTISELNKNWSKYIGWGLWMQGHIGVVSDTKGYYYAMDGSARNMVHYPMSKQGWTKCIKLKDVEYTEVNPSVSYADSSPTGALKNKVADVTITVNVKGKTGSYKAKNVNGSNYIQARAFLEALGYEVHFNAVKKRVQAGNVTLDVNTIIEGGLSYVHLREAVEFLNKYDGKKYSVGYDKATKIITVK